MMRFAQQFEQALLGLLLTVRHYRKAKRAYKDFERLLEGDLRQPAGRILRKLFRNQRLIHDLVQETFGRDEPQLERRVFERAVEARNILAHHYFRSRFFGKEKLPSLMAELQGLGILLLMGKRVAGSLMARLSMRQEAYGPAQLILTKESQHLWRKHQRAGLLAQAGRDISMILAMPLEKLS
jgi:hypothetical protein